MITDIFLQRYEEANLENIPNAFFVQIYMLFNEHSEEINSFVDGYMYSEYVNEYARIISISQSKLCTELGVRNLDKIEYKEPNNHLPAEYRILKNYVYDSAVNFLEKISLFEIISRDIEALLIAEIKYIENHIPLYKKESEKIKQLSEATNTFLYNKGEENLEKALRQLDIKNAALHSIRTEINERLKRHKIPLTYHNGFFQYETDPFIEKTIRDPVWKLISNPKYKNVEEDLLEALDRFDTRKRDPALYAMKALESMIKIVCKEKGIEKEPKKNFAHYIGKLNSKENGKYLSNEEKEELLAMFKNRHAYAHGPGDGEMPSLAIQQELRLINAAIVWIYSLSQR
jgi:hypothetical protein